MMVGRYEKHHNPWRKVQRYFNGLVIGISLHKFERVRH
jgi:hypothetical protein